MYLFSSAGEAQMESSIVSPVEEVRWNIANFTKLSTQDVSRYVWMQLNPRCVNVYVGLTQYDVT